MKKSKLIVGGNFLAALALLVFSSCGDNIDKDKENREMAENTGNPGLNMRYRDTTVSPKQNFYQFVNGTWMKETEIPADRTRWGGFSLLRKKTDSTVISIVNNASDSSKYDAGSDQGKAIALFQSEMDTTARNKAGIKPLQPVLDKINQIKSVQDLQRITAKNSVEISNPLFGLYASANPKNSDINSAYITPGSLGLPERDYYLDDSKKSKEIRQDYVDHITRMLQMIDVDKKDAQEQAEMILDFETQLAKPRLTKVERRDFRKMNNPRSIGELDQDYPAINWKQYLKDLGVKKTPDTLILMQPKYMKEVQDILKEGNAKKWRTLIRWATLNSAAGELTTEMEKANWDFYSKNLNGAKEQRPADERALSTVNGRIGEALGKVYVDQEFPPEAKKKAEEMIDNIMKAFEKRINKLEWMTADTKKKAVAKLDSLTVKIAYPDKWEDYSSMKIKKSNNFYENMVAAGKWSYEDNLSKIGEPVDDTEWGMSPQTVNAYYNPSKNEIVFPAAILQPPFYNYKADMAVNYGGIGAVIGHEISHSFDDSGSRFDAQGNLNNWWTDEDKENFKKRGTSLSDLYSGINPIDSMHINGEFTLGENIGDVGGVNAAYDGLQMYLKNNDHKKKIDGYTPEQRFFMSWATIWRTKMRDEALRSQLKTDPHSPGMYRAYVPLQNVDAFYKAFNIKEGDSMYVKPKNRVRIW
jgi:putative endopeptidase